LYYADESGFDEYYSREYGYAPRGEKVIGKIRTTTSSGGLIVAPYKGAETKDH